MASKFHEETLKIVVAQLCQNIGFQGIFSSSLDVIVDLLHRYLKDIAISTHRYTEHYGRTDPNLDDLGLAFREMGISISELEEYVTYVEPQSFPHKVPKLPIARSSNLNFLKPGAREILSRPLYVNEHLPPMYPEKEDGAVKEENEERSQISPQEKRPNEEEMSLNKKLKLWPEDEGEPVREIDSVMMTTSGYISSAREGKMPESRKPSIPMTPSGGSTHITKSPSSMIKKKATMEKIIRHKNHQGGILPGPLAKPKVKHVKLKPKIPLAPPGTGSLKNIRSPTGIQAPKLKIPNINKEKEKISSPKKIPSEKEGEKKKKEKREGKERRKKERSEGGGSGTSGKKKRDERREKASDKRKERTRIRMRGLSKEEELRRYKERENELIAALAASSAVTVTSIPPPSLRVREKTPEKGSPESNPKSKLSVFRKFPKIGSKDGDSDSSPDLMIDAPVVKEEKLSPPPSPRMDIPSFNDEILTSTPSSPRSPETHHHHLPLPVDRHEKSPRRIKKEKTKVRIPKKKSPRGGMRRGSTGPFSPLWRNQPEFAGDDRPKTPEGELNSNMEGTEDSPVFPLPPFPHGPSLIPPFSRFPFIPPFGAPPRPPLPDVNPMSHIFMGSSSLHVEKGFDSHIDNPASPPAPVHDIRVRSTTPVPSQLPMLMDMKNSSVMEKPVSLSPPKAPVQEMQSTQSVKMEKLEKEKKKEHKKEKKDREKERIKKKKEKKEREKKEKEEKKKEKERIKKERKEKKKSSQSESVPKITLKLQTETESGQGTSSETKIMPKLVIKSLLKHSGEESLASSSTEKSRKRKTPPSSPPRPPPSPIPLPAAINTSTTSSSPPSSPPSRVSPINPIKPSIKATSQDPPSSPPEIAKFSALVTRPPKGSQSKKNPDYEGVPPLKLKDSVFKVSAKKEFGSSAKSETKETTVPPLKIKNTSSSTSNAPSSKFMDDKRASHSKKSEKKEKRRNSPLVITTMTIAESNPVSIPAISPPQLPQLPSPPSLPPPIPIPSEVPPPKGSKKISPGGNPTSSSCAGPSKSSKSTGLLTETVGPIGHFVDDQGNEVWICPTCGKQDDGSPMIGCDTCDDWYHWICVGIHVPPSERENWYCPRCLSQHKQQRGTLGVEKKKRGRKKKILPM